MLAWWIACAAPAPAPSETTPPAPTSTPAPAPEPTVAPVPGIAEVLGDCGGTFREPPAYPNQLSPGDDLHRHTLVDPEAVCNDGTPAIVYVRGATDPAHLDDAVVHLQGGGDCPDWAGCRARWCGDDPTYDASKMSSAWAPEASAGLGILAQNPDNAFAGWNHVWVYYCSSDNWNGVSASVPPPPAGEPAYRLERRGHTIVAAALDALQAGITSDDGDETVAPLAPGATVLFSGTSAGSAGAQANLDFDAGALPEATVVGVFDSSMGPRIEDLPPDVAETFTTLATERWAARLAGEELAPFGDASCLAATPAELGWQCALGTVLPHGWITTPFFFRMDLRDQVMANVFDGFGIGGALFTSGVAEALVAIGERTTAADGAPLARPPSVFGPACNEHLGLEAGAPFIAPRIDTIAGPLAFHDALLAWLDGAHVTEVDVALDRSLCPP